MSYFSDLFKQKYQSPLFREFIEEKVREMSALRRENYRDMCQIDRRKDVINKIKMALQELHIELGDEFYEDGKDE